MVEECENSLKNQIFLKHNNYMMWFTNKKIIHLSLINYKNMATVVNMPRLSDTMTEGTVATWLKKK
jgi:hypothetical protein